MSESCMGIGLQFPHLWDVVKRYILRGDNYFQNGGLTTLAANIWSMPLEEAADVLEQYYKQHNYFPPAAGQRGGVNLAGLQAVHAVATAPDYMDDGSKAGRRKHRMLQLLDQHRRVVERTLKPPDSSKGITDYMAGDRAAIDETIAAIRSERAWDVKLDLQSGRTEAQDKAAVPAAAATPTSPVRAAGADDAARDSVPGVSPADMLKAKYGYDQLDQRIGYLEKTVCDRVDGLEKNIDRFLAQRQLDVGTKQVDVGARGVRVGVVGVVVGSALTIAALFLAPFVQRLFTAAPP